MSTTATTRKQSPGGRDYGYANARIRGMRSHLMKKPFLDELIELPDIRRLIQELSETEYADDIEECLIHGRDAAAVDEALKNNMVRTYQKVSGFINDEAQYILITLMARWDIFNIKTILRGTHMHLSTEQIAEGLLPAGYLTQVDLEALTTQDDLRAIVDTAMTWGLPFAGALSDGYAEYSKSGDLAAMELALDRYYASWALGRLNKRRSNMRIARRVLGMQIDIMNLVMVFRLQNADTDAIDVESFFLDGGLDISFDLYTELGAMSDIDEVLDLLRGTSYGMVLNDVAMQYLEANSIAVFERALEDYFMRKTLSQATGDPLGIGVAIAYLWAKQNEITNLRIIVKGKSVGMPEERVRGELILV